MQASGGSPNTRLTLTIFNSNPSNDTCIVKVNGVEALFLGDSSASIHGHYFESGFVNLRSQLQVSASQLAIGSTYDVISTGKIMSVGSISEDGIALVHNSHATGYFYLVNLTPASLSANRTITFPDHDGTVVLSDDSRLSDARTPLAHVHDYSTIANIPIRTAWNGVHRGFVAEQLSWKNYGNNHTIFDASAGTTPSGTACSNTDSAVAWTATYPTLMGWNGSSTYGVRVDRARYADSAGSATSATNASNST